MRAFPEAKVILTTRDPGTWYQSMMKLYKFGGLHDSTWVARIISWLLDPRRNRNFVFINQRNDNLFSVAPPGFGTSIEEAVRGGPEEAERWFLAWQKEVVATVPKEQLLVFDSRDGWGPLCRFLGVEPPPGDLPYPRLHEGEVIERSYRHVIVLEQVLVYGAVAGMVALGGWILTTGLGLGAF